MNKWSMEVTLDIQDNKAAAFMSFIQSLDFVTVKNQDSQFKLTAKQKLLIDEGLDASNEGRTLSHEQAMEELRKKHPKYFK